MAILSFQHSWIWRGNCSW